MTNIIETVLTNAQKSDIIKSEISFDTIQQKEVSQKQHDKKERQ